MHIRGSSFSRLQVQGSWDLEIDADGVPNLCILLSWCFDEWFFGAGVATIDSFSSKYGTLGPVFWSRTTHWHSNQLISETDSVGGSIL